MTGYYISFEEFKILLTQNKRYTGFVEGIGYVYWEDMYVTTPDPNRQNRFITEAFYELRVIRLQDSSNDGYKKLHTLKEIGTNAFSLYGIANSIEQLSTKPVIVGDKYIKINPQGTLVKNTNRLYTTKGELAKGLGRKLFITGVIIDFALLASGEQTWQETRTNLAINTGIYIVGSICPVAGIALGVAWFICNFSKTRPQRIPIREDLCPADATRVVNPYLIR